MKDGANLLAPACIRLGREPLLVQLDTLGMKEDADRRSAFVGTVTPKLQQCVFHRCIFVFSFFCLGGAFSSREGCKQSVCQATAETTAANKQTILQQYRRPTPKKHTQSFHRSFAEGPSLLEDGGPGPTQRNKTQGLPEIKLRTQHKGTQ